MITTDLRSFFQASVKGVVDRHVPSHGAAHAESYNLRRLGN